ncbi:precorrin-6y C5,15-methyltransferase (decarboxylating) subunit CbiE [Mobilicoccus pelagius]|uniref:Precorrin-6Y C5,15-methyltransferase n=1 Tax=Mobilicoccus pelagius NBRC 104925 TaxID=1089455 RepID=H5UUX8_9MICO|nr:precorrin-6y C5,15-methyltransferase (decarboxylating) subunit CbiE [Mobilicoccus pelagius]GAB49536.1 precorrin-6Y C5,15-methyltransferase [Mobilicoccus pelagius NBRC 104925]
MSEDTTLTGGHPVHVHGWIGAAAPLPASARADIALADLVVGGRRHLTALGVPEERRVVLGPVDPALDALRSLGPGQRGVVVASGDPGFFGMVRRLHGAGLDLVVHPAPSACALAFGRAGLPWEDAQIVSAHGRDLRRAVNVIRAHERVAVMTTVGAGIREIAAALTSWPRRLVLVEHLGEEGERVRWFTREEALALDPADIGEPNVVLAVTDGLEGDPTGDTAAPSPWSGPGMPWRLGERGTHARAADLRTDPLSALVVGAFGAAPGDLALVDGDPLVAAAVEERGAAVRGASPAPTLAGLPALDEPDLVFLAVPGAPDLAAVADWDRARCVVLAGEGPAPHDLGEAPAGWGISALTVPRMTPAPIDAPVDAPPTRHLVIGHRLQGAP